MRKWGLVVTLFYAAALLVLIVPGAVFLVAPTHRVSELHSHVRDVYGESLVWMCIGVFLLGQVLLLALTVDATERRLKPRTHIVVSSVTTGFLLAILTFAAVFSLAAARWGDNAGNGGWYSVVAAFVVPWVLWGVVFHRVTRESTDVVSRAAAWLLRGSVLELLIAVPSHVIVRRRNECCAPVVTGFGIATGIAIMLLSFGPSVLLLYKKRMDGMKSRSAASAG